MVIKYVHSSNLDSSIRLGTCVAHKEQQQHQQQLSACQFLALALSEEPNQVNKKIAIKIQKKTKKIRKWINNCRSD